MHLFCHQDTDLEQISSAWEELLGCAPSSKEAHSKAHAPLGPAQPGSRIEQQIMSQEETRQLPVTKAPLISSKLQQTAVQRGFC